MMAGTIKRLTDSGYGFIAPEDGGKDLFFHSSALVELIFDDLKEGQKVTFDIEESEKGPRAVNVCAA
jgi:CspA family cold shock protein